MKTLFVSFAALIFVFFIGCQSSITDPVETNQTAFTGVVDQETVAYKDAVSLWPGLIRLGGSICEPIHNTCNTTLIDGVIKYDIKPIRNSHHLVTALKVGLYINAQFKSNSSETNSTWRVSGFSQDIVSLLTTNQEVNILEKEYLVKNTGNYRLKLTLRFHVTEKAVQLVSMALKNSADIPIGDPVF